MQLGDSAAAAHFLNLLDEGAERFCFRVFDDNETRKDSKLAAKYEGALDEVWPRLLAKQAQGCGVYVVANAGEQTNDTIYKVRAVFADTDGAPLEPILACGLEPHIVVESSPGKWHVYWLVEGLPTDAFRDIQRNIAALFGTDKSVNDLARVMRLPGMLHQKGEPFLVRIIHESGAQPYSAETIREHFGAEASPPTATSTPSLGQHVEENRHADVLKLTLMLAASVRSGAMTRQEAFDLMRSRRDAGRWSRHVPDEEIGRALDGALAKGGAVTVDETATPTPALVPLDLSALMDSEIAPPRFLIAPIVPRGVATLLGGHGGVGKSMLGLTFAAYVAAGRSWGPYEFEQGRAVYVSLEDGAEIVRYRLRRIIETCGLPAADVLAQLEIHDLSDVEAELAVETSVGGVQSLMFTPMMEAVEAATVGADLVLIDNASDAFGANENARRQVRAFIRRLSQRAKANGGAVILLAHIDKQAAKTGSKANSYSGSTAWHNGARSRLALVESDGSLQLLHEKSNLGALAEPLMVGRGAYGVPEPRQAHVVSEEARSAALSDAAAVLGAIEALLADGVHIPAAESGPNTTFHVLSRSPELPPHLKSSEGKDRVKAAIQALARGGRIVPEIVRTANRKEKERWTLAHFPTAGEP